MRIIGRVEGPRIPPAPSDNPRVLAHSRESANERTLRFGCLIIFSVRRQCCGLIGESFRDTEKACKGTALYVGTVDLSSALFLSYRLTRIRETRGIILAGRAR